MAAQGHPSAGLDALLAAVASENGLHHGLGNMAPNLRSLMNHSPQPPVPDSAALDAIFGTNAFSSAATTAVSQGDDSITPLWATMLLNAMSAQNFQPQSTPVQVTRSGRQSRPPVQAPSQRLLAALQGVPAMLPILSAMETTGLIHANGANPGAAHQQIHQGPSGISGGAMGALAAALTALQPQPQPQASQKDSAFTRETPLASWRSNTPKSLVGGTPSFPNPSEASKKRTDAAAPDPDPKRARIDDPDLPEWPQPPTGKGSRKLLSKEEVMARRKERNKKSALESRRKKKEFFGDLEERYKEKEDACEELEKRCRDLEQEVERLRNIVQGAGLNLPTPAPPAADYLDGLTPVLPLASVPVPAEPPATAFPEVIPGLDFSGVDFSSLPGLDFSTIFNFPFDDGADDADFIPETSPKRHSDSDDSDEDEATPSASATASGKKKRRKQKRRREDNEDEDEDEFVDEEVEDEDLFLPIEDVPVPPEQLHEGQDIHDWTGDMMKALKVDTKEQLAAVMQKLVDSAGDGGVQPDVMEKLKSVIHLAQD